MSGRHQPENGADSDAPLQSPEEAHHSAGVAPDGVAGSTVLLPPQHCQCGRELPCFDHRTTRADGTSADNEPAKRLREWIGEANGASYALDLLVAALAAERASYASASTAESGGLDVERRLDKWARDSRGITSIPTTKQGLDELLSIVEQARARLASDLRPQADPHE